MLKKNAQITQEHFFNLILNLLMRLMQQIQGLYLLLPISFTLKYSIQVSEHCW